VPKPLKIKNNNKTKLIFKRISCGPDHNLLLTVDGEIYGFGCNDLGQLADVSTKNQLEPIKLESQYKFTEVALVKDCFFSVALSDDGTYYIWEYCGQEIITKLKAVQFDSFNKIFINYYGVTYKIIEKSLGSDNLLVLDAIKMVNFRINSMNPI